MKNVQATLYHYHKYTVAEGALRALPIRSGVLGAGTGRFVEVASLTTGLSAQSLIFTPVKSNMDADEAR